MAKNHGLLNHSGTIGSTFSETQSGTTVGSKPGPTREQVLHDKRFDRTRRNAGEFKQAVKNSSLLHYALGKAINGVRHQHLNGRMKGLLHRVAMQDTQNGLGWRQAAFGDCGVFANFEFNEELSLDQAISSRFIHDLDVITGTARLEASSFTARHKKGVPKGATHFRIVSCAVVLNFLANKYNRSIKTSEFFLLGKKTGDICFDHALKVAPGEVLLQVVGIEFYKIINDKEQLLKGGAMCILEAKRLAYESMVIIEEEGEDGYTAMVLKNGPSGKHLSNRIKALCHPVNYGLISSGNNDDALDNTRLDKTTP